MNLSSLPPPPQATPKNISQQVAAACFGKRWTLAKGSEALNFTKIQKWVMQHLSQNIDSSPMLQRLSLVLL
jgi:hypothetical protein